MDLLNLNPKNYERTIYTHTKPNMIFTELSFNINFYNTYTRPYSIVKFNLKSIVLF